MKMSKFDELYNLVMEDTKATNNTDETKKARDFFQEKSGLQGKMQAACGNNSYFNARIISAIFILALSKSLRVLQRNSPIAISFLRISGLFPVRLSASR